MIGRDHAASKNPKDVRRDVLPTKSSEKGRPEITNRAGAKDPSSKVKLKRQKLALSKKRSESRSAQCRAPGEGVAAEEAFKGILQE